MPLFFCPASYDPGLSGAKNVGDVVSEKGESQKLHLVAARSIGTLNSGVHPEGSRRAEE